MKKPFKKYLPHFLSALMIINLPVNVLSTTHANAISTPSTLKSALVQDDAQQSLDDVVSLPEQDVEVIEAPELNPPPENPPQENNEPLPEGSDMLPENSDILPEGSAPTPEEDETNSPPIEEETPESQLPEENETEAPVDSDDEWVNEAPEKMDKAKTYEEKHQLVEDAIEQFKKEQTQENLKKAIDLLIYLPTLEDYPSPEYLLDKATFTETILLLLEFVSEEEQNELLSYFAKEAFEAVKKTKSDKDYDMISSVVAHLPNGSERDGYTKELEKLKKEIYGNTDFIDWENPPEDLEADPLPDDHKNADNYMPGYDPDKYKKPPSPFPPFTPGTSHIDYEKNNGACYKVEKRIQNGRVVETTKTPVTGVEKVFCGTVEVPNPMEYKNYPWDRLVQEGNKKVNNSNPNASASQDEKDKEDAHLSNLTIQYTFEKDSDSPYYHDTGIRIGIDNTITYQNARDALYQISIRAKGKFVEDVDKALALLDGRIILVEDKGKKIPIEDFLVLFNETNIGVKALDTRSGNQLDLTDLVEIKNVTTVYVEGKEVELEASPIIDNSIVLFPIESIAKALGGKVQTNATSTIVEINGSTFTFADGKDYALYNGKETPLDVETRLNSKGIRLAQLDPMLELLGVMIEVEAETNHVLFVKR